MLPNFQKALENKCPEEKGLIFSYAVNTHGGIKKLTSHSNLDRVAIIQSSSGTGRDQGQCKFSFFAIYEGAGSPGAEAANYLRDNLHKIIFKDPFFRKNPTQALVNAILKANTHITVLNQQRKSVLAEKVGGAKQTGSQLEVVMLLEDQDEQTPTICLCASMGASRAVLSSNAGKKLFCLNNEHFVPGNQGEEERIIEFLTRRSGLGNLFTKSQDLEQAKLDLTEYICKLRMPFTRMLGSMDWTMLQTKTESKKKHTIDNFAAWDKLASQSVASTPDITAMQISPEEDFLLVGSSGIFENLQGTDLISIIWQQALLEALAVSEGKEEESAATVHVSTSSLVDTLVKLAALKRD